MIDLAMALALQSAGFGTYGRDIWFGTSPVLEDGSVTSNHGLWVNASTVSVQGDMYTDQITISSRYGDVIHQGIVMVNLLWWLNNILPKECMLSCTPLVELTYTSVRSHTATAVDMDAVDGEGRWVKSIRFNLDYKLPNGLPPIE